MSKTQVPKEGSHFTRKINYEIKKNIVLNQEQHVAQKIIKENTLTILTGKAGSGKTYTAIVTALEMLSKKEIEQIVLTRPVTDVQNLGYLPGGLDEKMDPWVAPIYDIIEETFGGKEVLEQIKKEGRIKIVPNQYMQGRTFTKKFVIVDECQNLNNDLTLGILTRLGKDGKMVFCGDINQVQIKNKNLTGMQKLIDMASTIKGVGFLELLNNHRHKLVDDILDFYGKDEDNFTSIKPIHSWHTDQSIKPYDSIKNGYDYEYFSRDL